MKFSEEDRPRRDFAWVIRVLKKGHWVRRLTWAPQVSLRLVRPRPGAIVTVDALVVRLANGDTVSWIPTHEDLLAVDWMLVK